MQEGVAELFYPKPFTSLCKLGICSRRLKLDKKIGVLKST